VPSDIEAVLKKARIDELSIRAVEAVSPATPIGEVYKLMDDGDLSAVIVCEEDRVVGIFTQRDILYRTALEAIDDSTPIEKLMSPKPVSLQPHERLADAIKVMAEGGYRHLPLVDDQGRVAGLITNRDVLKFIADYFPETVLNLPPRLHQQMLRPEGG